MDFWGIKNVFTLATREGMSLEALRKEVAKARARQLEHALGLDQTRLRYFMQRVDSDAVPLPPEASCLSEKEKLEIKQQVSEVVDGFDKSIDVDVAKELKKDPGVCANKIREELITGMVYYMFFYVLLMQSEIDPSLL